MKLFPTMQSPSKYEKTNTTSIPANAQTSIASEISLNPIVSHHTRKNGFSALSNTPVSSGPCFGVDMLDSFFLNVVLICMNAKINSAMAPKIEIINLNSGNNSKEKTPIPSKTTNGNSTIVWPICHFQTCFGSSS